MRVVGIFCKLFGGTAGTQPANELKKASEVKLACSKTQVDGTSRENAGYKSYIGGLKDVTLTFNYDYDVDDEGYNMLRNAYFNGTAIALFCADDKGNGVDGDWEIFDFDIDQPNDDLVKVSITAKPTHTGGEKGRNPSWVNAAGA